MERTTIAINVRGYMRYLKKSKMGRLESPGSIIELNMNYHKILTLHVSPIGTHSVGEK